MIQQILVFLTFAVAAGFLLKKFVWNPIYETRKKGNSKLTGGKTKCGSKDCGCH